MGGRGEGLHWGMGGVDREHSLVGDEQAMPSQDWQYPGVSPSAVDLRCSAGEGVGRNEPDGLVGKGRVDDIVPTIREPLGSNVRRGQDWGVLAAGG